MELNTSALPATSLNGFSKINTIAKATSIAIKLYNMASVKNCFINWVFIEPNTLRMPTSFALFADCAVD